MLELTKGSRLADRYTLEWPLGRGGEASTWLARDRMTNASVALKVVPARLAGRLRDEWQANLRLMHAHIVRVFEFHEDQGAAFYSMQYVDGADLSALTGQPLSEHEGTGGWRYPTQQQDARDGDCRGDTHQGGNQPEQAPAQGGSVVRGGSAHH